MLVSYVRGVGDLLSGAADSDASHGYDVIATPELAFQMTLFRCFWCFGANFR